MHNTTTGMTHSHSSEAIHCWALGTGSLDVRSPTLWETSATQSTAIHLTPQAEKCDRETHSPIPLPPHAHSANSSGSGRMPQLETPRLDRATRGSTVLSVWCCPALEMLCACVGVWGALRGQQAPLGNGILLRMRGRDWPLRSSREGK